MSFKQGYGVTTQSLSLVPGHFAGIPYKKIKNMKNTKTQILHTAQASRRAGLSAEPLTETGRHTVKNWLSKIHDLAWAQGATKQWQLQSAFDSAAAMGIDPDQAHELLLKIVAYHGGLDTFCDVIQNRLRAYGFPVYPPPLPSVSRLEKKRYSGDHRECKIRRPAPPCRRTIPTYWKEYTESLDNKELPTKSGYRVLAHRLRQIIECEDKMIS
jgi:hypothetical protein